MNNSNNSKDINVPKLLGPKNIIKIGENAQITIGTYQKRINVYQDVVLELKDKEIFLGRFVTEEDDLVVKYKNGKILIGREKAEKSGTKLTKVLTLYEVIDDTFYSCSEIEALSMFDPSINGTHLQNKNTYMSRSDLEKIIRLRVSWSNSVGGTKN